MSLPKTDNLAEAFAVPTEERLGIGEMSAWEKPSSLRKATLITFGRVLPESMYAKAGVEFTLTGQKRLKFVKEESVPTQELSAEAIADRMSCHMSSEHRESRINRWGLKRSDAERDGREGLPSLFAATRGAEGSGEVDSRGLTTSLFGLQLGIRGTCETWSFETSVMESTLSPGASAKDGTELKGT